MKALTLMRRFERNEDNNYHRENRVLLAKYFGTLEEYKEAEELAKLHIERGSLPMGPLYDRVFWANLRHYAKMLEMARLEWFDLPPNKRKNKPFGLKE